MDRARKARKERIFGDKSSHGRRGYSSGEADNQVGDKEGEEFYLSMLQIESMELIPETKVKMMNGDFYLLRDSAESIMDQIRAFIKSCVVFEDKGK